MSDTKAKHTAGPWVKSNESNGTFVRGDHGGLVASMEAGSQIMRDPDAEFIVRACNAHDDLLAAVKELIAAARPFASFIRNIPQAEGGAIERVVMVSDVIRVRDASVKATEIIAKAEPGGAE